MAAVAAATPPEPEDPLKLRRKVCRGGAIVLLRTRGAAAPLGTLSDDPSLPPPTPQIEKKLRQVQELEEARAKGEALNEDQLGKIEAAEDLRRQLSALSV